MAFTQKQNVHYHLCIFRVHLNGLACIFLRLLPLLHTQVDVGSVGDIRDLGAKLNSMLTLKLVY